MEQRGAFSQGGKGDSIGRRRGNWKRAAMDRKREENRKRVLWQGEERKPEGQEEEEYVEEDKEDKRFDK